MVWQNRGAGNLQHNRADPKNVPRLEQSLFLHQGFIEIGAVAAVEVAGHNTVGRHAENAMVPADVAGSQPDLA